MLKTNQKTMFIIQLNEWNILGKIEKLKKLTNFILGFSVFELQLFASE